MWKFPLITVEKSIYRKITDLKNICIARKETHRTPQEMPLAYKQGCILTASSLTCTFFYIFADKHSMRQQEKKGMMLNSLTTPMQVSAPSSLCLWQLRHRLFGATESYAVVLYEIQAGKSKHTTEWAWSSTCVQRMAAHTVGQKMWPLFSPASKAALKWSADYHDVNIDGIDCIMGRSNAGRLSVSAETELPRQKCDSVRSLLTTWKIYSWDWVSQNYVHK